MLTILEYTDKYDDQNPLQDIDRDRRNNANKKGNQYLQQSNVFGGYDDNYVDQRPGQNPLKSGFRDNNGAQVNTRNSGGIASDPYQQKQQNYNQYPPVTSQNTYKGTIGGSGGGFGNPTKFQFK